VRAQLNDAVATAPGAVDAAKALTQKLNGIEDGLYQVRSQADEDGLVYPPGPTERLSSLISRRAPRTRGRRRSCTTYSDCSRHRFQAQLAALAQALKGDLPKVNAALRAASSPRVVPRAAEIRPPAPDGR